MHLVQSVSINVSQRGVLTRDASTSEDQGMAATVQRAEIDVLIGQRVHHVLWRRKIQQRELATALGITQSTLSRRLVVTVHGSPATWSPWPRPWGCRWAGLFGEDETVRRGTRPVPSGSGLAPRSGPRGMSDGRGTSRGRPCSMRLTHVDVLNRGSHDASESGRPVAVRAVAGSDSPDGAESWSWSASCRSAITPGRRRRSLSGSTRNPGCTWAARWRRCSMTSRRSSADSVDHDKERAHTEWDTEIEAWLTTLRGAGRRDATVAARRQQSRLCRWAGQRGPWTLSTDDLLSWCASRDWSRERRRHPFGAAHVLHVGRADSADLHNPATDLPSVKPAEPRPKPCADRVLAAAVAAAPERDVLDAAAGG